MEVASCLVNSVCGGRDFFRAGRSRGGPEPASRERGPSCPPAGHPTEKTRSNGQPNRLDRKSRFPALETGDASERIDCSTFDCSTLSASGRADLRVRPLGRQPKTPVPTGSPTTWIGNPNVDPSADTAGSTPHRHPPQPFPEGEILDSPGFAAQRLPWVGDSHNRPEPCRVRLTRGSRKPVSPSVSGPGKDDRIPPAIPPSGPRQASPFRADAICLSCHPG